MGKLKRRLDSVEKALKIARERQQLPTVDKLKDSFKKANLNPNDITIDADGSIKYPEFTKDINGNDVNSINELSNIGAGGVRREVAIHNDGVMGGDSKGEFNNDFLHGSSSTGVPVELEDLSVGGIPVYNKGVPADYSPYQYTQKPTDKDFARANIQESLLMNEWELKEAIKSGGLDALNIKSTAIIDDMIEMYKDDWTELVPELEKIKTKIGKRDKVNYTGGESPQGIESFDVDAMEDGLFGRGVYMTDSDIIAGGGEGNDVADLGYASDAAFTRMIEAEKGVPTNELPNIDTGEVGRPTVYQLSNSVNNPWLPEKMKIKKKDFPKDKLAELEDTMYRKGKNIKGKWPMSDEYLRNVMGNDWINGTLQEMGYDGISHTGGAITGAPSHNVTIAFKPSQVRAKNAAFDPQFKDSSNLLGEAQLKPLAGVAGASVLGTGAYSAYNALKDPLTESYNQTMDNIANRDRSKLEPHSAVAQRSSDRQKTIANTFLNRRAKRGSPRAIDAIASKLRGFEGVAKTIGSGMLNEAQAGLFGIAASLDPTTSVTGSQMINQVQNDADLMYIPKTQEEIDALQGLSNVVDDTVNYWGSGQSGENINQMVSNFNESADYLNEQGAKLDPRLGAAMGTGLKILPELL